MAACSINRCPETYEKNKDVVNQHLAEWLPNILQKLESEENELILDHGCASGGTLNKYLVPYAEKTNSTIYALDNSESMCEYGEENFSHPRVKYVTGTLTGADSPVKGVKFNKIFSLFTVHFVQDYKSELQALADSLAPGGEMFLIVVTECHIFDIYKNVKRDEEFAEAAKEHLVIPQWLDQYELPFDILKKDIKNLALEVKDISSIERTHTYKDPNSFADMMFALCAFAKNLPPEDYAKLKEKYRKLNLETETKTHKPHARSAACEYVLHYTSLHALLNKQ